MAAYRSHRLGPTMRPGRMARNPPVIHARGTEANRSPGPCRSTDRLHRLAAGGRGRASLGGGQRKRNSVHEGAPAHTLGEPRWEEDGVRRRWSAAPAHLHRIIVAPVLGILALLAWSPRPLWARRARYAAASAASTQVLGVYAGAADPPAVRAFAATLGTRPHFAMDFLNGSTWRTITQTRFPYAKWKGKGYSMIWGVNMLPDTFTPDSDPADAGGSCAGLTAGATGEFDHYFQTVATNIVKAGFPTSIIRPGWEFNGGWFPWAAHGCASAFAKYFDDIVTTMRAVPG